MYSVVSKCLNCDSIVKVLITWSVPISRIEYDCPNCQCLVDISKYEPIGVGDVPSIEVNGREMDFYLTSKEQ